MCLCADEGWTGVFDSDILANDAGLYKLVYEFSISLRVFTSDWDDTVAPTTYKGIRDRNLEQETTSTSVYVVC